MLKLWHVVELDLIVIVLNFQLEINLNYLKLLFGVNVSKKHMILE